MSLAREMAEAAKERRKRMGFVQTKPIVCVSRPIAEKPIPLPEDEPVPELAEIQLRARPSWAERKEIAKRNRERKAKVAICVNLITENVCVHYNVTREDLLRNRRPIDERIKSPHVFVLPKYVAFWLCYHVAGSTIKEIARYYRRDRSTVRYGIDRMEKNITENPAVALSVAILRGKIISTDDDQSYWGA